MINPRLIVRPVVRSFASKAAGKLRKPSIPFRDFETVKRNARSVINREDLALDAFLSRHRPLFLLDLKGENARQEAPRSPWIASASGRDLNPEMKDVPEEVVETLRPYEDQGYSNTMEEEADWDLDPLLTSSFASQLHKKISSQLKNLQVTTIPGLNGGASVVLINKKDIPRPFEEPEADLELSPVSDSFLRNPSMYATSVKRKRRTKMNRHKYKKRRKAQRAMRRKLNK
ncbi:hypothetical protein TRVA0_004S01838 [Trichomonascus vanleenenianus]|uniref:uncharacterized protein n=1 Tax=Trichomonascus vanleenenianus TaxID=2268995 RepID=UPI003ECA3304